MVRTSRRADRLLSSTTSLASTEPRQQPDEPAGARGEQGRSIIASGGSLACLPACRVRHDQIGQCVYFELLRDRQCPRENQIPGPGPEDRGTEDAAITAGDDFDQTRGLAFGLGPVVLGKRPTQYTRSLLNSARRGFGQPERGKLGIGKGNPGQGRVVDLGGETEQGVPDNEPGVVECHVGKLGSARNVANGEGTSVSRAQSRIDGDAFSSRGNAGRREIE